MANDPRFAFWCEACNWNLVREADLGRPGPVQRFLGKLNRRSGRGLRASVIARRAAPNRLDASAIGAGGIAILTDLAIAGLFLAGVRSVLVGGWYGIVIGAICFAIVWVMRPRVHLGSVTAADRQRLPVLFGLVDRVAESVGAPRVDGLVVDNVLNASYGRVGWRRRRILRVGLPLFAALETQERVALVAHEIGHTINGDPLRRQVVWASFHSLLEGWRLLEPEAVVPGSGAGIVAILSIPFRALQLVVARAVLGVALLQLALCYRGSQRAEYAADAMAARVAGSDGLRRLLARQYAVRSAAASSGSTVEPDSIREVADRIRTTPAREIERLRRLDVLRGGRLDATHPPLYDREHVATALPQGTARIVLDEAASAAIDRELMLRR